MKKSQDSPKREPTDTCNARLKQSEGYCSIPAGFRTGHEGFGRCYLHGGVSGTYKHGKRSKVQAQKNEQFRLDYPDYTNTYKVRSLRAPLSYLERYDRVTTSDMLGTSKRAKAIITYKKQFYKQRKKELLKHMSKAEFEQLKEQNCGDLAIAQQIEKNREWLELLKECGIKLSPLTDFHIDLFLMKEKKDSYQFEKS